MGQSPFPYDAAGLLAELTQGESQTREFKRQQGHPERVAGELVAVANGAGVVVFFGVDDDGLIIGLPDTRTAFQSLTPICIWVSGDWVRMAPWLPRSGLIGLGEDTGRCAQG